MSDNTDSTTNPSWTQALLIYIEPRVFTMLFLGFSAGLTFPLVVTTLTAWMTEANVPIKTIGFFGWIAIMFSIKMFWAPIVDRINLPILTKLFGHRRSWMLVAQVGIFFGLFLMASTDPEKNTTMLALFALLTSFSAATQDIGIDAYRIESAEDIVNEKGKSEKDIRRYQGAMAAIYITGYRIAFLFASAGALYIAHYFSWQVVYYVMACSVSVGFITTLIIREPRIKVSKSTLENEQKVIDYLERSKHIPKKIRDINAWFIGAVICPFVDFIKRYGKLSLYILMLIGIYRISDTVLSQMANPFYLKLGFSKIEIANITKFLGFGMAIFGTLLGGILASKYGLMRPLLLGAILVAVTNLFFAVLAKTGYSIIGLSLVISADSVASGLAGAVFIAYLSNLTNTAYTATQYALFSSIMTLPAGFLKGFSGIIVSAYDNKPIIYLENLFNSSVKTYLPNLKNKSTEVFTYPLDILKDQSNMMFALLDNRLEGFFYFFIYVSAIGIPAAFLIIYLFHKEHDPIPASDKTQ